MLPGTELDDFGATAALYFASESAANHSAQAAALIAKARAQLAASQIDDAAATLRTASTLAGRSPEQLIEIARLQVGAGDTESARASLQRTLRVSPKFLAAQTLLAGLEAQNGRIGKALQLAANIRVAHPLSSLGDVITGDVLMRAGRFNEAADAYETGLRRQPNSALLARLYTARRATGHKRQGLGELEAWLERHPGDDIVQNALASAYMDNERYDEAIAQHEVLVEQRPDDAAVLNNLAWLYQLVGDPRAMEQAKRAYDLAPNNAGTIDTFGWILVNNGEVRRGLTLLREAQARTSGDAGVHYHLAVALQALDRLDEAREQLQAALRSGDGFPEEAQARELLRQLADPIN